MGFFDKIKNGIQKTKDSFVKQIETVIHTFKKIDENFFEELEETLIMADIGVQTSMDICEQLRAKVKKANTEDSEEIKQMLKEIIGEMLAGDDGLKINTKPSIVLVIGVNGVGKTTSIGKLASHLKSEGKKVILGAADTFRAAAIDQLQIWADRADVDIVRQSEGSDPAAVVYDTITAGKSRGCDIVICDTAGRLHNKKNLMDELAKITRVVERESAGSDVEILLVIDATTGQNGVNQAKMFQEVAGITGIILTKLDGTAKGGIIIPIKNELGLSVKYVGVGEQVDDLQPFIAQDFVDALFE